MKRDEYKKIVDSPRIELETMLKESREKLRALRFDLAAGKVKNVAELRKLRKMIARILTILPTKEA